MGDNSAIEWTDATWNPVRGCSIVSKGCTNCYAMRQAHRSSGAGGAYEGLTKLTKGGPVWTGATLQLEGEHLIRPVLWRRPRRIFVNSMSDLFHESLDYSYIDMVFAVMVRAHQHIFQVLTKRPQRMREYMARADRALAVWKAGHEVELCARTEPPVWPPKNIWLGVSVEDQASADERIPLLLKTPAAVRWISAEPLLGPVNLSAWTTPRAHRIAHMFSSGVPVPSIDWVVAGGESGPGARAMHPDWARALRDQCAAAGVPFFFKQWGNWLPRTSYYGDDRNEVWIDRSAHRHGVQLLTTAGHEWVVGDPIKRGRHDGQPPSGTWVVQRLDKKASGRELDGRTHDEYPA